VYFYTRVVYSRIHEVRETTTTEDAMTAMWSITTDPITDLALEDDILDRLTAALDGPRRLTVVEALDAAIAAKLAEYGISEDGSWADGWDASEVVESVLDLDEIAAAVEAIDADAVVRDAVARGADSAVIGLGVSGDGLMSIRFADHTAEDAEGVPTWLEHLGCCAGRAARLIVEYARTGDVHALHQRLRGGWQGAEHPRVTIVIGIPVSTEWEPEVYDAALLDAGWRRSGPWTGNDVNATAPVTPAATAPGTRDEWLAALDAETAGQTAWEAYSAACSAGVFGGLPLALARCDEERLHVVAEAGWTARYEAGQGWV
jgi:hypothetical protein